MASSGAEFNHFHIHQVCPSVFNKQPSLNVSCYTPELTIISCVIVYFWCKYVLLRMTVFGGVVVHSADGRIQWRFMMKEINKGSLYPPEQSWYITHHCQVFKVDCFTTNSQGHFSLEDCQNFMWNSAAQNMIIESCSNDNKSNTVDQNKKLGSGSKLKHFWSTAEASLWEKNCCCEYIHKSADFTCFCLQATHASNKTSLLDGNCNFLCTLVSLKDNHLD